MNHPKIKDYRHISTVMETAKMQMDKVRSGQLKPLFTASKKETEKIGGLYPGDQVVIAGRTGTGKSALVTQYMAEFVDPTINPYYVDKLIILVDSYEMADWRVAMRMISSKGEIEAKALLDYNQRLTEERFAMLKNIADSFKNYPIYVSTYPLSVKKWEESKKNIAAQFPHHYIVNIQDHSRLVLKENEAKEEELITNLMLAGVRLKNNHQMINIFLSQMNRAIETGVARGQQGKELPIASDIFGSDAVFQCAEIVIALHRPGIYGLEEFRGYPTGKIASDPTAQDNLFIECILKQRDGELANMMMMHNLKYNKIVDYPEITSKINNKQIPANFKPITQTGSGWDQVEQPFNNGNW